MPSNLEISIGGEYFYEILPQTSDLGTFNSTSQLYFGSPDCSGQAYTSVYGTVFKPKLVALTGTSQVIMVTSTQVSPPTVIVKSIKEYPAETCTGTSFIQPLRTVEFFDTSALLFPYPIQYPVQFSF